MRSYFYSQIMKILFITLLLGLVGLFSLRPAKSIEVVKDFSLLKTYKNDQFNYEVKFPVTYKIYDQIPELVTIEKSGSRIRINSGCFDSGTENFTSTVETGLINGELVWKESFYENSLLKMKRINLNKFGRCYGLELVADSDEAWGELGEISKTFKFTR
jgi:hypothetical protein